MIKNLFILSIIFMSASCAPYYQVFETKPSSNIKIENQYYVFENDTVKVTYSFWESRGVLYFNIYNKLNVPLYLDLKKSSFISNGTKYDYWVDASTTSSIVVGGVSYSSLLYGASKTTTTKEDQIIFIAPNSGTDKSKFILYPFNVYELNGASTDTMTSPINKKKISKYKYLSFTQSNTPFTFRNFLTISTSDKFDKESYIDNGFYLSKVLEVKSSDFWGEIVGMSYGHYIYQGTFKSPQNFYVELK